MTTVGPPGTIGMARGSRCRDATEQLETSLIGAVTGIRDRRVVAVDRERGIVFAFAFFDHRPINWTWQLGELFKIENDKISRIEAIFIRGPYGACSGWSTYEQRRSEEPQDGAVRLISGGADDDPQHFSPGLGLRRHTGYGPERTATEPHARCCRTGRHAPARSSRRRPRPSVEAQ